MKIKFHLAGAATCLLASPAVAAEAAPTQSGTVHYGRLIRAVKASEVIGLEVENYQPEKLGQVGDPALDNQLSVSAAGK